MNSMTTTPINLQEEYANTEIAKILNILDEELVGLAPVKLVFAKLQRYY
jgi:hypothetical protein